MTVSRVHVFKEFAIKGGSDWRRTCLEKVTN